MSKADKMFEELGYCIDENEERIIYDNCDNNIIFEFKYKTISFDNCICINIRLLQAINEKVKELGWLDE